MTMCILVNGELKCTDYDDSTAFVYKQLADCERDAAMRFYGLTDIFHQYGQPYERIVVGCDEVNSEY
jgi:hypothetical protein